MVFKRVRIVMHEYLHKAWNNQEAGMHFGIA